MARNLMAFAGTCIIAVLAMSASAQTYTLNDGNSLAHFDTSALGANSRVGMDRWEVDGVNHMYSQWFWYRTDGMANEARLNSLNLIAGGVSDSNFNGQNETLYLNYGTLNTFTIETTFVLQGGSAGSGQSDIGEQIRITNRSSAARHFTFFQYCDFDLSNDIQDDFVGLINSNAVRQIDFLSGVSVAETVFTPTFTLSEMGVYSATLQKLDDGVIDNLDGSAGPLLGRRDYTWAFQWDVLLGSGDSFLISKDKRLSVPTPGSIALLSLGGLAMARRRTR